METHKGSIAHPERQSKRFLFFYTMAAAGGSAAYVPFLTLWLPVHVSRIWAEDAITVLSYAAFTGAVAASIANIVFGWASDRTKARPAWIVAGLFLASGMLYAMQFADALPILLTFIVLWQIALNMMLAPLMAWAGDCVPHQQKGLLGGLLSLSPVFGALCGAIVTIPGLADPNTRLMLINGIVIAMVLPVILLGKPIPMPHLMASASRQLEEDTSGKNGLAAAAAHPVKRMWAARLLVQIAEAALFAFLLIWFRTLDETLTDNFTATLFTAVLLASVPVALLVGRWSDRVGRPVVPLAASAGGAAIGLVILSFASTTEWGILGYAIFGVMGGAFLALHSSQTLRVLPDPATRGRDLGIFNLTNTVPSLIMPWLTLALVPLFGFSGFFVLLAIFSA
ncbi:MAG: MFS transporter, partial [Sphingomonadales bacterium]